MTSKWSPIQETMKEARVSRGLYRCAGCEEDVPVTLSKDGKRVKNVFVDHIDPVISVEEGFVSWDETINRLFCEKDNLRVLCHDCHSAATNQQRAEYAEWRSIRKEYPREESTYRNMVSRCNNPKATGYKYYGGRGIAVCDRWQESFFNFLGDMGPRPEDHTLDRINVHGNYTPDNCRWATHIEQGRNTTANNFVEHGGEVLCLEEWGERLGIKPNSILTRLRRGWPVPEALGLQEREKPFYSGRLSQEDIEDMLEKIDGGMSQSEYGRQVGMDSSQVSRLYRKFKRNLNEPNL